MKDSPRLAAYETISWGKKSNQGLYKKNLYTRGLSETVMPCFCSVRGRQQQPPADRPGAPSCARVGQDKSVSFAARYSRNVSLLLAAELAADAAKRAGVSPTQAGCTFVKVAVCVCVCFFFFVLRFRIWCKYGE
jgi:hypothetical protein